MCESAVGISVSIVRSVKNCGKLCEKIKDSNVDIQFLFYSVYLSIFRWDVLTHCIVEGPQNDRGIPY